MDITKLSFTARTRTGFETFDLTLLMVKENFAAMMRLVLVLYLPVAAILWFALPIEYASFVMWWLKPLLERPLLTYLANKSFSIPISTWQCIRAIRQLAFADIIMMLTINRLSPNRAYLSPIEQLERAKGKVKSQRKNAMLLRGNHKQTYWMILCLHFEGLLLALLMLLAYNFIPHGISFDDQFMQMDLDSPLIANTYYFVYLIAMILVAPYYVTGGFLAYINTRIQLEAWDLELSFKRIAGRFSSVALVVCLSGFLLSTLPTAVEAQEQEQVTSEQSENTVDATEQQRQAFQLTHDEIEAIYQDNELIERTNVWQPNFQKKEKDTSGFEAFLAMLTGLGNVIGYIIWALVIALGIWLIVKLVRYLDNSQRQSFNVVKSDQARKVSLPTFFADVEKREWPKDLLTAAEQANAQGEIRLALTYLLQFSLSFAIERTQVIITASMTEQECSRALKQVLKMEDFSIYQSLINLWCQLAWAHREVSAEQVAQLVIDFTDLKQRGISNEQNA